MYSGVYENRRCVVKVYKNDIYYEREKQALERMGGQDNVPHILNDQLLSKAGNKCLVITKMGDCVQPKSKGRIVHGHHIRTLVEILRVAHARNLCHRDVKPDNIYIDDDGKVFLSDWSSSCDRDSMQTYQSTFGFYDNPTTPEAPTMTVSPKDDLRALVKSAYLMLFNSSAPHPDLDVTLFWRNRLREDTIWKEAMDYCDDLDYDRLQSLFITIK